MIKMLNYIQHGIILFWALWFSLVFTSDFTNFLQKIRFLPETFTFSSKNYDLVGKSLSTYGIQHPRLTLWLFSIVTVWAFLTAISFWIAFFASKSIGIYISYFSFLLSLSMSACFMLWHEIFLQYDLEHSLMIRFGFQLITLMLFMYISNIIE